MSQGSPERPTEWTPEAVAKFTEILSRPGNRFTYLGRDVDGDTETTGWLVDIIVYEGDGWRWRDPATGQDAPDPQRTPGSLAEGLWTLHLGAGAETYAVITLRLLAGQELRAAPHLRDELVSLLHAAADDTTWALDSKAKAVVLADAGRATVRECADTLAREGRVRLDPPHLESMHIPLFLPVTKPSLPDRDPPPRPGGHQPPTFTPDMLTILSDPHSQAVVRSLWTPEQWTRPANALPYYTDAPTNVQVYLAPDGDGSAATPAAIAEAARSILDLDDRKVSAYIICMGKWFADTGGKGAPSVFTRVHVEDILGFRGVRKHVKGGYRPEQKREARDDILFLRSMWLRSNQQVWEETPSGRRKCVGVTVNSPLLHVEIESIADLWGEETPYAFRICPGSYAQHYLSGAAHWTAKLLRPIMRYHPYLQRRKMRLGIYLTFQWRIRAYHNNFDQPWHLSTLLENARIALPAVQFARFRRDVEKDLHELRADGVVGSVECLDPLVGNEPPRVWWPKWLKARWRITPPETVRAALPQPDPEPRRGRRAG